MRTMTDTKARTTSAGATYYCPWGDYRNTSFAKTYAHAIVCGAKHGYFNLPVSMILKGLSF